MGCTINLGKVRGGGTEPTPYLGGPAPPLSIFLSRPASSLSLLWGLAPHPFYSESEKKGGE